MWTIALGVLIAWLLIAIVIPGAFWGFLYFVIGVADRKRRSGG